MNGADHKLKKTCFLLCVLSQEMKMKVLEQVQDQLSDILDKALIETVPLFAQINTTVNGKTAKKPSSR